MDIQSLLTQQIQNNSNNYRLGKSKGSPLKKLVASSLILLAACGQSDADKADESAGYIESVPGALDIQVAADLTPADPSLASKYDRSCRSCHSSVDAAAPLTGHKSAWAARLEAKGADGLLASAKAGLNAMPPMGLCNDCTDAEFNALIAFMAGKES